MRYYIIYCAAYYLWALASAHTLVCVLNQPARYHLQTAGWCDRGRIRDCLKSYNCQFERLVSDGKRSRAAGWVLIDELGG